MIEVFYVGRDGPPNCYAMEMGPALLAVLILPPKNYSDRPEYLADPKSSEKAWHKTGHQINEAIQCLIMHHKYVI